MCIRREEDYGAGKIWLQEGLDGVVCILLWRECRGETCVDGAADGTSLESVVGRKLGRSHSFLLNLFISPCAVRASYFLV